MAVQNKLVFSFLNIWNFMGILQIIWNFTVLSIILKPVNLEVG